MTPELQSPPISSNLDLELPAGRMRELVDKALERIVDHISSLDRQPSADVEGCEALARSLVEPLPEKPAEYSDLLDLLFKELVPKSFNTAGPGYLAYIPGGGLFHSAVADLISDAVNRYVGVWIAAPGLAQLEANVIRWFSEIVGYPAEARGILTTGGSLANFTALVTARRNLLPDNFLAGTLYASDQVHHSVVKAAMLAGFPAANVREIAADDACRIRLDHLERSIESDRREGKHPFLVVGNAGTTNTGAVDDLDGLANLAARENMWLHIDAAYGGFFMLTRKGREVMRGIEHAHSITLDPHKGLFLPYGTGSLLVRDGDALRRAHSVDATYLPPMQQDTDLVDFCLYSPELSRNFRGLRVWLPIKMHGIEPFRRNLEEKLELAAWAAAELRSIPSVEVLAEPQLSLVAFRVARSGWDTETANEFNQRLMRGVNARKRVYLTGTVLRGRFVIRICVLSFRTHHDHMQAALEDIRTTLRELT